jgi:hypothetical protein
MLFALLGKYSPGSSPVLQFRSTSQMLPEHKHKTQARCLPKLAQYQQTLVYLLILTSGDNPRKKKKKIYEI